MNSGFSAICCSKCLWWRSWQYRCFSIPSNMKCYGGFCLANHFPFRYSNRSFLNLLASSQFASRAKCGSVHVVEAKSKINKYRLCQENAAYSTINRVNKWVWKLDEFIRQQFSPASGQVIVAGRSHPQTKAEFKNTKEILLGEYQNTVLFPFSRSLLTDMLFCLSHVFISSGIFLRDRSS